MATREDLRGRDGPIDGYRYLLDVVMPQIEAAYRAQHGHDPGPRDVAHSVWRILGNEDWTVAEVLADIHPSPVPPPPPPPPPPSGRGAVSLDGMTFKDAGGKFLGYGASFFMFLLMVRRDPGHAALELAWLKARGVQYIRALTNVGAQPYWAGREIDPFASDYWQVVDNATQMLKAAGMRVQWVLFADAQVMMPDRNLRNNWVEKWASYIYRNPDPVIFVEVANEHWQNGIGLDELRTHAKRLKNSLSTLVAASAPEGHAPADFDAVHRGGVADLGIEHWRRTNRVYGWDHAIQPWFERTVPPIVNNEPMGPGSSVSVETSPAKIVAAMLNTYVAGGPAYCYHSDAGVRHQRDFGDDPNADIILSALNSAHHLVPAWVPNATRINHYQARHPFKGSFGVEGGRSHQIWPDGLDNQGVVRAFSARSGKQWIMALTGLKRYVNLYVPRAMAFKVYDPLNGVVLRDVVAAQAGVTTQLNERDVMLAIGEDF